MEAEGDDTHRLVTIFISKFKFWEAADNWGDTPQYYWKIAGARGPSLLICLPTHPFYGPVGGKVSL